MEMLYGPAAMYSGAIASEERWRSRRLEAREAFMEFQRMHPNASFDDYNKYADQISEGNRYIRGGLPPSEVMKSMAEENQRRYMQQRLEENLSNVQKRAQIAGTIDALAGRTILSSGDDKSVVKSLASQLGYDEKNPQTHGIMNIIEQQYPNGFSSLRSRAQMELTQEWLPVVSDLIKKNPGLTNDQVIQMFPDLGGIGQGGPGQGMVQALINSARQEAQKLAGIESQKAIQSAIAQDSTYFQNTGGFGPMPQGLDEHGIKSVQSFRDGVLRKSEADKKAAEAALIREQEAGLADFTQKSSDTFVTTGDILPVPSHLPPDQKAMYERANQGIKEKYAQARTEEEQKRIQAETDALPELVKQAVDTFVLTNVKPAAPATMSPQNAAEFNRQVNSAINLLYSKEAENKEAVTRKGIADTSTMLREDETFFSTFAVDGLQPDELQNSIRSALQTNGLDGTPDQIARVQALLEPERAEYRSSSFLKETAEAKAKVDGVLAKNSEVGQTMLTNVVDATFPEDGQSELNLIVKNVLLGRINSQFPIDQLEATILSEIVRSPEFVKAAKNGASEQQLFDMIASQESAMPIFKRERKAELPALGYPFGDKRGDKEQAISATVGYAENISLRASSDAETLMMALTTGEMEYSEFADLIAFSMQEVEQSYGEAIDSLGKMAETSSSWSTTGPITLSQYTALVADLDRQMKERLATLEEINKRGQQYMLGANRTAEDEIMQPGLSDRMGGREAAMQNRIDAATGRLAPQFGPDLPVDPNWRKKARTGR